MHMRILRVGTTLTESRLCSLEPPLMLFAGEELAGTEHSQTQQAWVYRKSHTNISYTAADERNVMGINPIT